ncbi:hypothetical protein QN345_20170, partial [Cryobacterium sp. 10I1]|nr:hypothetical protein [Cryobacterium sp. 10I1]
LGGFGKPGEPSADLDRGRAAIDEIEAIAPQAAEDDDLAARAERLGNLEELRLAAAQSRELLSAEENPDGLPDAVTLLDAARRQLERAGDHD